MEKLNELMSKACLASELGKKGITVDLQMLSQVRDEVWAINRRAEAAEAKLAELAKQEPVPTKLKYSSVLPKFIGDTDEVESYHCMVHGNTPERKTVEEAYADAKQMCSDLFTRPAPANDLVPGEWTNEQCLEFLSIAFRHAEISGDIEMDDIRLAVKMVNAAAPEVE